MISTLLITSYGESVTEPGKIQKVAIKVVPMYIEPDPAERVDAGSAADAQQPPVGRPPREKTIFAGVFAVAASIGTASLTAFAIVVAGHGVYNTSTALAWFAIGLSVVAIVVGTWAIATDRGRRWAVIAIVLGVLANPYVLLTGLTALGGVRS